MSGLRICDVHKSFGTQPVLCGIDLKIPEGSFASILGPSGSGKTTLLRVIAGFERSDRGEITLRDLVLENPQQALSPDRRHIGYVPQDGNLFPHLSVAQNVGFGLSRQDRHSKRVGQLLEMVALGGLEKRYPHQLSGGQQQRVALARALAIRPSLVLLDEPFSSLDASLRASVRRDVWRVITDAGATALLVTHDQDEALSLSDEVAIIDAGRIGQYGSPVRLYGNPDTPKLARSLGEANFLNGVVRGESVETSLGLLRLAGEINGDTTTVSVLIRPEQIDLTADQNGVAARVIEREYYGHDALVRVAGEWSPSTELTVRMNDTSALPDVGSLVGLSVRGTVIGFPLCKDASNSDTGDSIEIPRA